MLFCCCIQSHSVALYFRVEGWIVGGFRVARGIVREEHGLRDASELLPRLTGKNGDLGLPTVVGGLSDMVRFGHQTIGDVTGSPSHVKAPSVL